MLFPVNRISGINIQNILVKSHMPSQLMTSPRHEILLLRNGADFLSQSFSIITKDTRIRDMRSLSHKG